MLRSPVSLHGAAGRKWGRDMAALQAQLSAHMLNQGYLVEIRAILVEPAEIIDARAGKIEVNPPAIGPFAHCLPDNLAVLDKYRRQEPSAKGNGHDLPVGNRTQPSKIFLSFAGAEPVERDAVDGGVERVVILAGQQLLAEYESMIFAQAPQSGINEIVVADDHILSSRVNRATKQRLHTALVLEQEYVNGGTRQPRRAKSRTVGRPGLAGGCQ